jgi:hypothetical protein
MSARYLAAPHPERRVRRPGVVATDPAPRLCEDGLGAAEVGPGHYKGFTRPKWTQPGRGGDCKAERSAASTRSVMCL